MGEALSMSRATRLMAGIILILVPTIEYGGYFLLKSLSTPAMHYTDNAVREDRMRAGHAHAGVIILLSLVGQVLADGAALPGWLVWFVRIALPVAAVLMSAGFFLAMPTPADTHPGGMIALVLVGAMLMAAAVLTLAVGLLRNLKAA
jgi:hypothetical protein